MLQPKFDLDSTIELIKVGTEKVVMLPWNGSYIPFIIRMLNSTQLKSCGDFSVLSIDNELDEDSIVEDNFDSIIKLKNTQEKMLEMALVSPTFKELCDVLEASPLIDEVKSKLKTTKDKVDNATDLTIAQRKELLDEIKKNELYLGFLYPDDFIGAFIVYVTQKINTDIDKVTSNMLLSAAISADKWSGRPSDYLDGVFTEYQKTDIDKQAIIVLHRFREQSKIANSNKWIRGRKRKK